MNNMPDSRPGAVSYYAPERAIGGVVVACPHSGRFYPPDMRARSKLDALTLRRSEDGFVDELFQDAPAKGAHLLVCEYARAYVDVNRHPTELDPALIADFDTATPAVASERVRAGLGVIPGTVGDGFTIYDQPLLMSDVRCRLNEVHLPWHETLSGKMSSARERNGAALLLDCHSMPASASGSPPADIVLGDRFGSTCAPLIINEAIAHLRQQGFKVARNDPYAGGYTTLTYGRPFEGLHALQIEINRSLYMVEGALTKRGAFGQIRSHMSSLTERLVEVSAYLAPRRSFPAAAE